MKNVAEIEAKATQAEREKAYAERAQKIMDAAEARLRRALADTLGRSPTADEIEAAKRGPFVAIVRPDDRIP